MIQHRFALALAAVALSVGLTDVAEAYPTTARSGSASVTGAYRPLNLNLSLVETPPNGLSYSTIDPLLSFEGVYEGTFTGDGYEAAGQAGTWTLQLFSSSVADDGENTITAEASAGDLVGRLIYASGFTVTTGTVPTEDTPVSGDTFALYATVTGSLMRATVGNLVEGISFDLVLLQDLQHLGPFNLKNCVPGVECNNSGLNLDRVKEDCFSSPTFACGLIPQDGFFASSAPEPTTLALFGLGLAGLGWRTRARR